MREIIVIDGNDLPNPEDMAMIQALYSRSPRSVKEHLEKVKAKGSASFVEQYMVQYGHKSIGDCGTTTICVENVSMLAAKAIQDSALYNGQEASTRYLDMSKQQLVNPLAGDGPGCQPGGVIQGLWMHTYNHVLRELIPHFEQRFPIEEGQKPEVWKKAIKAKAFDVARGFLPAGVTTYVAWHTNLRQANDHLKLLRNHPAKEIREIAEQVHSGLLQRYPSSFSHKRYGPEERYVEEGMAAFAYWDDQEVGHSPVDRISSTSTLDLNGLRPFRDLLMNRPPKAELHPRFRQFGTITYTFPLDFGSFRDLQRQRSPVQEMPLLTTKYGFHPWYLDQLPAKLREDAEGVIAEQVTALNELEASAVDKQFFTAMGFLVPTKTVCTLPAAVYIAELRSSTTVHPTLRRPAQLMGEDLKARIPHLAMHHDMTPDAWSIKRGQQDIVKKEVASS